MLLDMNEDGTSWPSTGMVPLGLNVSMLAPLHDALRERETGTLPPGTDPPDLVFKLSMLGNLGMDNVDCDDDDVSGDEYVS